MSPSRRADRRAYVMELKTGVRLVLGGVKLLYGDGAAVLTHLGG